MLQLLVQKQDERCRKQHERLQVLLLLPFEGHEGAMGASPKQEAEPGSLTAPQRGGRNRMPAREA